MTNSVLPISDKMYEQNRFPATHWVMMGLNKSGSYKQEDVDYTESFPTYEEKKTATIQEIKNRIKERKVSGMISHIFVTKMKRTWCVSSLNGDDYVGREMMYDTNYQQIFTKKGSMHEGCLFYTWMYHFLLLVGISISGLCACVDKNKKSQLLMGRIAIFGVILFMSIWECNSRYLVCFLPALFLPAFDGYVCCASFRYTQTIPKLHIHKRK